MNLEYEFRYQARLKPPVAIGAGPYGTRMFFEVIGGEFEGKRLKGKILSGGGDWLLAGADGFSRLDVRIQRRGDLRRLFRTARDQRQGASRARRSQERHRFRRSVLPRHASLRDGGPPLCLAEPVPLRLRRTCVAGLDRPVQLLPRDLAGALWAGPPRRGAIGPALRRASGRARRRAA